MDTHIAPSPDLEEHGISPSARLPGEPDPDAEPPADRASETLATPPAKARARGHRAAFLRGAAAVGVVAVAGGAFLLSRYDRAVPVPENTAVHRVERSAGIDSDRPLAPSAALAGVEPPGRPSAVVLPRYTPPSREQDLGELLAIRPGSAEAGVPGTTQPVQNGPARPAASAPPFVPHEPGSAPGSSPPRATDVDASSAPPRPAVADVAPTVLAAAAATGRGAEPPATSVVEQAPPAARPQGAVAPAPAPGDRERTGASPPAIPAQSGEQTPAPPAVAPVGAPQDAVARVLQPRAAPMSDEEQVEVLELVTQIATMVRDLSAQNAALRADFARTTADGQARLADFARRIGLAEATRAVAAAKGPGDLPAPAAPVLVDRPSARPAMAPVAVTRPDVALPSAAPQDAKRYRVQAASPGLALLAEIARGGGDGAQIQVTVGDTLPGWGKVRSVAQRGTSWVVSTEHGAIE